jgi:uncharacterized protein YdeI (YjbR/CyaY-like superfamily)
MSEKLTTRQQRELIRIAHAAKKEASKGKPIETLRARWARQKRAQRARKKVEHGLVS